MGRAGPADVELAAGTRRPRACPAIAVGPVLGTDPLPTYRAVMHACAPGVARRCLLPRDCTVITFRQLAMNVILGCLWCAHAWMRHGNPQFVCCRFSSCVLTTAGFVGTNGTGIGTNASGNSGSPPITY